MCLNCVCQWNTALQAFVLVVSFAVPATLPPMDLLTALGKAPVTLQALWVAAASSTVATGLDYRRRWNSQHPPWRLVTKTKSN